MEYDTDELDKVPLVELKNDLEFCRDLQWTYTRKFPPTKENYGWEESDEIVDLRNYIEALEDEIQTREFKSSN